MPKNFAPNPTGSDFDKMPEDRDFFIISPGHTVGSITQRFNRQTPDGQTVHHAKPGEPLTEGMIFPAKQFGPGVDVQRLVDLGAIREAYPHEVETYRSAFGEGADEVGPAAPEAQSVDPSAAARGERDPQGAAPDSADKPPKVSDDMQGQRALDEPLKGTQQGEVRRTPK